MADTKPSTELGYEASDTRPATLVVWGVLLVSVTVLAALAAWAVFELFAAQAARKDVQPSPLAASDTPPEPRLVVNEPADLKTVREEEQRVLDGYAWIDKQKGVVRIPVERAMDLVAMEGLPTRGSARKVP